MACTLKEPDGVATRNEPSTPTLVAVEKSKQEIITLFGTEPYRCEPPGRAARGFLSCGAGRFSGTWDG